MRVFLDSNVLVSSFTANGVSRELVDLLIFEHAVIISPQVLEESKRTITAKFVVDDTALEKFFLSLVQIAEIVLPPFEQHFVRDPDDIDILGAAIKG